MSAGIQTVGGCAAALQGPKKLEQLPFTQHYLKPLECVKEKIEAAQSDMDERSKARLMEKMNVIEQVEHLKSYPQIQERLKRGELEIEGWYYDIKSGSVSVYDESTDSFCVSDEYQNVH
ncbi:hypothetical protein GCM10008936_04380 [Alkalibacterium indicireducens]|uniref:carbonic anhydrase n=1 Tax=Alkalibacterium indicireducens TaxID=398758 RepID=A0ABP3KDS8_9LACT